MPSLAQELREQETGQRAKRWVTALQISEHNTKDEAQRELKERSTQ
jgi:hypothetical protein